MDQQITNVTFSLSGPATICAFALVFLLGYLRYRDQKHLLLISLAGVLFFLGMLRQIVDGLNQDDTALSANLCYVVAAYVFYCALNIRRGIQPNHFILAPVFVVMSLQVWYFSSLSPNTLARIYLINFFVGVLLTIAAVLARPTKNAPYTEKFLFWTLLLFGLHFFPRTIITAGVGLQVEPEVFLISPYWIFLQLSLAGFGALVAIALLCASIFEIASSSSDTAEVDPVTRLISRHTFKRRVEAARNSPSNSPACLLIANIDQLPQISRRFGYDESDRILADMAQFLTSHQPEHGLIGRYGGQEFLMFWPQTNLTRGISSAHTLLKAVRHHDFCPTPGIEQLSVSISIVELNAHDSYAQALERLRQAIGDAAANGGNTLVTATPSQTAQEKGPAMGGASLA